MTKTATYGCDECGNAIIGRERLPEDWRHVTLESIDGDNIGLYRADLCSPECAANVLLKRSGRT